MKFEYVKPDLEELELVLEGSFLEPNTKTDVGVDKEDPENPGDSDEWD